MKPLSSFLAAGALLWSLSACDSWISVEPPPDGSFETNYKPVYLRRSQLESSIRLEEPRDLKNLAKIYYKEGFLFITEQYEGVHLIDNRNPAQPQKLAFLRVYGSVDLAMKGHTLYVDNAVDLVAIDLSEVEQPRIVSRVRHAFPGLLPPDGGTIPDRYKLDSEDDERIIVDWIED
ncbi:hypothetical protein SAMN05421823_11198 [Catalinimonas alkaloidigena]|uniref:LVIVD repeat-containing protein n=1 Tax=Catalinimonas alkaloidigena TaxID=1075417 RepID=A0A1G9RB40_9BACT|nr:hypothetical protein [Catalinimonas alkaloidigena]SDM20448.1 hypothetical protein SAMN05421823_11198 [Catalinimonas alkaloidigena]